MTTVVIDASVWVSALLTNEGRHPISLAWIDRWREDGNQFTGPITFLTEVGCAVGRQRRHAGLAITAVSNIQSDVLFTLVDVDADLAR